VIEVVHVPAYVPEHDQVEASELSISDERIHELGG
jgi:hypothetical protein